jgi:hypothetical protein
VQETEEKEAGCLQYKLRGNVYWSGNGDDVVASRLLALAIMTGMESCGYELVATVDMSTSPGGNGFWDCRCP